MTRARSESVIEPRMTRRAFLRSLGAVAIAATVGVPTAAPAAVPSSNAFRARVQSEVDIAALRRQREWHG